MQRVDNGGRREAVGSARPPRTAGRPRAVGVAIGVVALLTLAACTSGGDGNGHSPAAKDAPLTSTAAGTTAPASNTPSTRTAPPAIITTSPASRHISPITPVRVGIRNGKLTGVTMVNPDGKKVTGELASDGTSWHSTEALGYSRTYRITATGVDTTGSRLTRTAKVTTVTPNNQTMPYLQRVGGYPLGNGETYGVAIVPVVHFDEPITNRAAAEKTLSVTTSPQVAGAWNWVDDQNAHWRPEHYWPSGTKVTVSAKVYGKQVSPGLYGQSDVSASFTIGRRQVTVANDTAPKSVNKVRVYNAAGKVIRTMNTSMGEHSGERVNGQWINFYTLDGTYTVLGHEQPAKMCSATYGLPANAPGGYPCENIYNATKISTDGIYLHELDTTVWSQDHGQDVSHGCLNLNYANSKWYFTHSMVGDPVEIHGAKGAPELQIWEGGDWSVPWSTWVKGGALR